MSASSPEPALHERFTLVTSPGPTRAREGRLWLSLRTAHVAVQVASLSAVGWIGAAMTLLPLVLRGAPKGRRVRGVAQVMHLLDAPQGALRD